MGRTQRRPQKQLAIEKEEATQGEGAEAEGVYLFKTNKEKLTTGTGEDQLAGQEENQNTMLQEGGTG